MEMKEKIKQNFLDLISITLFFDNYEKLNENLDEEKLKKAIFNYIDSFIEQLLDLNQKIVDYCDERTTYILRKRLGVMDDGVEQTYNTVGKEIGISVERVRQILMYLSRKIRGTALPEAIRKSKVKDEISNEELLNADIGTFNLSRRSYNCLKRGNLHTIKDIISCSIDDIKQLRNLGSESAKEIIDFIHKNNFRFKNDYEISDNKHSEKMKNDFLSALKARNMYNYDYFIENNNDLVKIEIYNKINIIVSDLLNLDKNKTEIFDEKELLILRKKLGIIKDGIKENYEEIAKELNITSNEAKEIYNNAFNKMYKDVIPKIIRDYKMKDIKSKEELLNKDIEILSLTSRTYNCLKRNGIDTINELVNCTIDQIKQVNNINENCINEIINTLNSIGLSLKKDNNLLDKYKKLLNEKQELNIKNNELNNEINEKLNLLNNKKSL